MTPAKVLVLTDTHVSNPGSLVKGIDSSARLRATLDMASVDHPDAACAVVMGDLVHWGGPGEYAEFLACLGERPWPVHLMLGNHDNRAKFIEAFPDAPLTPSGHVQQVVDLDGWRLVLLDSHDEQFSAPFHSGVLCEERMAWLVAALDGAGDRRVVVFVHHPPMITFFDGMDEIGLRNSDELLGVLGARPNVEMVVSGHLHRSISGVARGVTVTILQSTSHQSPLALGESSTDLNTDEPPAFGIVLLHETGVTVHTVDVDVTGD